MSLSGQWKRFGCCPFDQDDIPAPPQNLAVFELTGFNYRTLPVWFDSTGQRMIPLQFSVVYDKLYYRWSFYKQQGDICENVYHLSTSDDVFPVIHDAVTGKKMNVKRTTRHNGYTSWFITC